MVPLTKDSEGRSPFWICCYRASDGRRLKKSTKQTKQTKQTERTKALEVCLALERAEGLAGQGTLTETRTRALLAEVLERTTGETLPFHTVEGFLQNWLHGREVSKARSTFLNYRGTVTAFLSHLGGRAKVGIAGISAKDVSTFRDAEIASGKNPNTIRGGLKNLEVAFNAARRQGIITTNPVEAVEAPSATRDEDGGEASRQPFSAEQVTAMLEAAKTFDDGKEWEGAILFANYTGARIGDTRKLAWGAIDLPAKTVTFRDEKTRKVLTLNLHDELHAHLLDLPAPHSGKALVFPTLAGDSNGFRCRRFDAIMERAGVARPVLTAARGPKGRTVHALSWHSFRHKLNSDLANAGGSQEIRKKFVGHSSNAINDHYTHHELETYRVAIGKLPGIGKRH